MSALIGHAKAARIIAECYGAEADRLMKSDNADDRMIAKHLGEHGAVYWDAADRMEQAMRDEATANTGDPV